MIIKELVDCYDLMVNSNRFQVTDFNYSKEDVSFVIIINEDGLVKRVNDLREGKKGVKMAVPYHSGRSGEKPPSYFLCDNSKFLLGYGKDGKDLKYFDEYIERAKNLHMEILKNSDSYYKSILEKFFDNRDKNIEIIKEKDSEVFNNGFIVLRFGDDDKYIHDQIEIKEAFRSYRKSVVDKVKKSKNKRLKIGTCLITGDVNVSIARTHKEIRGVYGGTNQPKFVSFNQKAFESYGKKQSYNASISDDNMFKYTTALNELLASDKNKIDLFGSTIVFWSSKLGAEEEQSISAFVKDDFVYNQNGVKEIQSIIKQINQDKTININKINLDDPINMYILGLCGGKARISVKFWFKNSLVEFIELINKHFEDTKLIKRADKITRDGDYEEIGVKVFSVLNMIKSNNEQNLFKNLVSSLFNSILTGAPYPTSIYNKIISKVRSGSRETFKDKKTGKIKEGSVINHTRVSFIKGYLKRYYRYIKKSRDKEEEVTVSLNKESKNVAYNLGRIFAILEKIQMDSNNGSTNIREKYLSSASSTPKSIFPNLLNLAQYHIAKINKENNRMFNYYDKIIGEILLNINEFPAVFSSDEQGMFILGYYHQREDIYTPKKDKEEN